MQFRVIRFVIGQYVPSHGDVISHVNITSVRVEDGGTFKCTATNRVGEASHSAELYVYGKNPISDTSKFMTRFHRPYC